MQYTLHVWDAFLDSLGILPPLGYPPEYWGNPELELPKENFLNMAEALERMKFYSGDWAYGSIINWGWIRRSILKGESVSASTVYLNKDGKLVLWAFSFYRSG